MSFFDAPRYANRTLRADRPLTGPNAVWPSGPTRRPLRENAQADLRQASFAPYEPCRKFIVNPRIFVNAVPQPAPQLCASNIVPQLSNLPSSARYGFRSDLNKQPYEPPFKGHRLIACTGTRRCLLHPFESGHVGRHLRCQLCATSRHMRCSKRGAIRSPRRPARASCPAHRGQGPWRS
jgi:hypothetical protein